MPPPLLGGGYLIQHEGVNDSLSHPKTLTVGHAQDFSAFGTKMNIAFTQNNPQKTTPYPIDNFITVRA